MLIVPGECSQESGGGVCCGEGLPVTLLLSSLPGLMDVCVHSGLAFVSASVYMRTDGFWGDTDRRRGVPSSGIFWYCPIYSSATTFNCHWHLLSCYDILTQKIFQIFQQQQDIFTWSEEKRCILLRLLLKLSHDSLGMTRAITTGESGWPVSPSSTHFIPSNKIDSCITTRHPGSYTPRERWSIVWKTSIIDRCRADFLCVIHTVEDCHSQTSLN